MTARPWNLRLNLDDFNGLVASVYSDYDRALILQGIALGANGGSLPDGAPPSFLKAFEVGAKMYQEAVEYQDKQARRGRASAERRREKFGTAQPHRAEPPFEPPFEPGFEPLPEPNDNRQSNNDDLQSSELKLPPIVPQTQKQRGTFVPPSEEETLEHCKDKHPDWHPSSVSELWHHYDATGWTDKDGKQIKNWKNKFSVIYGFKKEKGNTGPTEDFIRKSRESQNSNPEHRMYMEMKVERDYAE